MRELSILYNMERSEVNEKYVLTLVENSDATLSVRKILIPNSEASIAELYDMVKNPDRTLYDMSSYFYSIFPTEIKAFSFCYPSEYDSSFIVPRSVPARISSKYRKKQSEKERYFKKAFIYIRCLRLSETINKIQQHNEIKLYSRDNVGFSTFTHTINENITVQLKTNFGYGSAAYFNLAVKYKDIAILPYSYLVHYYYANMKSLMACTRAYRPMRESWDLSINFIANFVNQSLVDTEKFLGEYVRKEIQEMMKGLRSIMVSPKEVLNKIKNSTAPGIRFSVIRPFNKNEFLMMETMPDELTTLFKAEKITGALLFINSLIQVQDVCGDMSELIDEILLMNKNVKPEIPPVLNNVRSMIDAFKKEVDNIEQQIKVKEHRKLYFDKRIKRIQAKMTFEQKIAHDKTFREKNPLYVKLEEEINELSQKMFDLQNKIFRRAQVEKRLTICLKRAEDI